MPEDLDIADALAQFDAVMTPASEATIVGWIGELSVISPKRKGSEFEAALLIKAYADRLAKYPADIVKAVMVDRSWKWFPSWDELRTACEVLLGPRKVIRKALEDAGQPAEPKSERVQADRVAEILAEVGLARREIKRAG